MKFPIELFLKSRKSGAILVRKIDENRIVTRRDYYDK